MESTFEVGSIFVFGANGILFVGANAKPAHTSTYTFPTP